MTPTLESLARLLAAHPRWRWLPGMLAVSASAPRFRIRLHAADEGAIVRTPRGTSVYVDVTIPETAPRLPVGHVWIPNLSDPVTAAALLPLAREVSGWPEAVACRLGGEWAVHENAESFASWCEYANNYNDHEADDKRPMYATEIEALAAVILRGGE